MALDICKHHVSVNFVLAESVETVIFGSLYKHSVYCKYSSLLWRALMMSITYISMCIYYSARLGS